MHHARLSDAIALESFAKRSRSQGLPRFAPLDRTFRVGGSKRRSQSRGHDPRSHLRKTIFQSSHDFFRCVQQRGGVRVMESKDIVI